MKKGIKKITKVNRLTFIKMLEPKPYSNGQKEQRARFLCDCGTEKDMFFYQVASGRAKSCGCFCRDVSSTHKKSRTSIYRIWVGIIQRCYNPKNDGYKYYGACGITVCDEWRNSFENFYKDMGDRPANTTLDRIDVLGRYEPLNCRWASIQDQNYNQAISSRNKSGRVGVSFRKQTKKWRAIIGKDEIGSFVSFEDACKAREQAELERYGIIKNKRKVPIGTTEEDAINDYLEQMKDE